jgi:TFIIF-interacting CTD phosphatase-like protein
MNIVLDLDETIIHSHQNNRNYDFVVDIPGGGRYYVSKRPNLKLFLQFVYKEFRTVSYWTAATEPYAYAILKNILTVQQQERTPIIFTRKHLSIRRDNGRPYKPLSKIFQLSFAQSNRILPSNTIMVDDLDQNFVANPGNGLVVPQFRGDPNDKVLSQLIIVLKGIITFSFLQNVLMQGSTV